MSDTPKTPNQHDDGWGDPAKIKTEASLARQTKELPKPSPSDPLSEVGDDLPASESTTKLKKENLAPPVSQRGVTDWGEDDAPAITPNLPEKSAPHPLPKKRRWLRWFLLLVFLIGLAVAGVFSWLNSRTFKLDCTTDTIAAKRGTFWPKGLANLKGKAYLPIQIAPQTTCNSQSFKNQKDLDHAFLDSLTEQARLHLKAGKPKDIEQAEIELQQALMLTRSTDQTKERQNVESLLGDVDHWAGSAYIEAARENLKKAEERFEAATRRTSDAEHPSGRWVKHVQSMKILLDNGPSEPQSKTPSASPQTTTPRPQTENDSSTTGISL